MSQMSNEDFEGLYIRIQEDVAFFQENMPEKNAIAWHGYLAGLLEWGVLSVSQFDRLLALLPPPVDDIVQTMLLGRENDA